MKLFIQNSLFLWLLLSQVELNAQNSDRRMPKIAMDQAGNFVVVFEDDRNGDGVYDIYMRGFNPDGTQRFAQNNVNTNLNGQQYKPAIAMDLSGNFVVVWEDDLDGNGFYDIYMRGFNPDGTERFAQRRVNNLSNGQKYKPAIAMSQAGNFVVVWEDDFNNNGNYDIYIRGFTTEGIPSFAQDTVNTNVSGQQYLPVIAMSPSSNFIVVWQDDTDGNGYYEINQRGFYANGSEFFPTIVVNSDPHGQQKRPAIAISQSDKFVVVWQDDNDDDGKYDIYARGFFSDGTERFADITVNTVVTGQQKTPVIAMDNQYNFVVAWADDQDEDGYFQILAKGFYSNGGQRFSDLIVTSVSSDLNPAIVADFILFQNYPNPFNPVTSIQYALTSEQFVTLKVYDILGKEIEILVNEEKPTGTYQVTWHAANQPSGVYFYQLRAGNYLDTKKMILLK